MNPTRNVAYTNLIAAVLLLGLLFFGRQQIFILTYIGVFIFTTVRTLATSARKRNRLYLILAYGFTMLLQIIFCVQIVFAQHVPLYEQPFRRLFGVLILLLPLLVSQYVSVGKYSHLYLPSLQDLATVSFAELKGGTQNIANTMKTLERIGSSLSPKNIKAVAEDLPRNDSFHYINNDSLTPEYFIEAEKHLDDPFIYIVISCTGSPASEIISVFTQKLYNHASLSFDKDLKTTISYNGGERVYPPGLNQEILEFFHKKPGASILIYKLPCSRSQKQMILEKVNKINREGSAYNMMGLIMKYSHKPNIMFCSQFVYRMLEFAGLSYFEQQDGSIKPTDLIEKDYYRKLIFDSEIRFDTDYSQIE